MQIICSWCGKNLETKKPKDDKRISHGICKKCARKVGDEILTTKPRFQKPLHGTPQATGPP